VLTLYDHLDSGNSYKIRLALTQLGIPFRLVQKDIMRGETRTADFLTKNPNGRIPTVELEDGRLIFESGAILYYFGDGTALFPGDRFDCAQVLQWMFFEQYSHEPYVAVARFWMKHTPERVKKEPALFAEKQRLGYAALDVMERHLTKRKFFVADRYSIADIALYAYTHVADEGGFDLEKYPKIRDWMDRVRSQVNYIPITQSEF
jgi:glutathione S-transferase